MTVPEKRTPAPVVEAVDAHHHLWDVETRFGSYTLDDLQADVRLFPAVTQTVFVDCGSSYRIDGPEHLKPVGETEYVARYASEAAAGSGVRIAGIVGHADLCLGDGVEEVLEAHLEAANGLFRGIRQSGAHDPTGTVDSPRHRRPLDLYRQDGFRRGAAALAERGLSFDAWQYYFQLDDLYELGVAVPALPIIVNHLGGPLGVGPYAGRREEIWTETKRGLARLAQLDNTTVKLGGIGMVRYGTGWEQRDRAVVPEEIAAHWAEMISWTIDCFGPDRCMFESNFPVDAETVTYDSLWQAFTLLAAQYSPAERHQLFAGTARRVYDLPSP